MSVSGIVTMQKKAREAYRYLFFKTERWRSLSDQCRYVRPIAHNMLTEAERRWKPQPHWLN